MLCMLCRDDHAHGVCLACHDKILARSEEKLAAAKVLLERVLDECEGKLCDWCGEHFVSDRDTVGEVGNGPGLTNWICDPCQSKSDSKFVRHRHVRSLASRKE